ncbi:PHP domain-containing protein, partial [bacterium]|nr:PHP domain-containing protein [bacterium]
MRFDFHTHTNMSDGRATPEALVWKASARDLDAIAVTDHDTTAGVALARAEGEAMGVRVIPGVELSCEIERDELGTARSCHLIALGFELGAGPLEEMLARIRAGRVLAARETTERLALAGYPIESPSVASSERTLCRPHLADALVAAGHARSRQDAFVKFLGGDAYRSSYSLPSAEEAIRAIHRAGGLAIYAHPSPDEIDRFAPRLRERGLDGIEVFRASFRSSPRSLYAEEVAKNLGLLVSGGSDWHGVGGIFGDFFVTEEQIGPL